MTLWPDAINKIIIDIVMGKPNFGEPLHYS